MPTNLLRRIVHGVTNIARRRSTAQLLSVAMAMLLLIDWPAMLMPSGSSSGSGSAGQKTPAQQQTGDSRNTPTALSDGTRDLLLKQYENAVKEIQGRIEQENILFALKFTLVGGILAMLFAAHLKHPSAANDREGKSNQAERPREAEKPEHPLDEQDTHLLTSPGAACFFWAAVLTSAIIDTRILFHADIMGELGHWIRECVEPVLYPQGVTGWETFLAGPSPLMPSWAYPLLRLNASLLTLVMFAATLYLYSGGVTRDSRPSWLMRRICRASTFGCYVVFFLVSIHFRYSNWYWIPCCGTIAVAGILSSWQAWRPHACPGAQGETPRNKRRPVGNLAGMGEHRCVP